MTDTQGAIPAPTKVTLIASRKYRMHLEYEVASLDQVAAIEAALETQGFSVVKLGSTSAEDFETDMNRINTPPSEDPWDQPQQPAPSIGNGEHPVCPLHKKPMDKRTRKGDAYHSYNGKNCSGQGWWGDRPRS